MIQFEQMGTRVKVIIDPKMSNKHIMYLYWECGTEWFAELLVTQLTAVLSKGMKQIRSYEYEQGWKDAKAKNAKKTYFYEGF